MAVSASEKVLWGWCVVQWEVRVCVCVCVYAVIKGIAFYFNAVAICPIALASL